MLIAQLAAARQVVPVIFSCLLAGEPLSRPIERMKLLQVTGNEYEHHIAELQDIAVSGDFWL